jgi:hypothetical protein
MAPPTLPVPMIAIRIAHSPCFIRLIGDMRRKKEMVMNKNDG